MAEGDPPRIPAIVPSPRPASSLCPTLLVQKQYAGHNDRFIQCATRATDCCRGQNSTSPHRWSSAIQDRAASCASPVIWPGAAGPWRLSRSTREGIPRCPRSPFGPVRLPSPRRRPGAPSPSRRPARQRRRSPRCDSKCGEQSHLRWLCQRGHLTLDAEIHAQHAAERVRREREAHGQLRLFPEGRSPLV